MRMAQFTVLDSVASNRRRKELVFRPVAFWPDECSVGFIRCLSNESVDETICKVELRTKSGEHVTIEESYEDTVKELNMARSFCVAQE